VATDQEGTEPLNPTPRSASTVRQQHGYRLPPVRDDQPLPSTHPAQVSSESVSQPPDSDITLHVDPQSDHMSVVTIPLALGARQPEALGDGIDQLPLALPHG